MSQYYVRTDGNDANTGTADTAGGAKRTLQAVSNLSLQPGDVVTVRAGTYVGFTRHVSDGAAGGTSGNPIRFSADTGVKLTDYSASGSNNFNSIINIEGITSGYHIIEGFEVDGTNANGNGTGRGIRSADSAHNIFRNNHVHHMGDSNIFASRSDFIEVSNNICHNATGQHGVYVNGSDSYIIRGNTCYSNNWNGIHANVSDGVNQINSNGLIEKNTVHDNGQAGMDLTGINTATIRNNLVYAVAGNHGVVFQNSNSNATTACHDNTIVNNTIGTDPDWALDFAPLSSQPGGATWTSNCQNTTVFNNILIGTSFSLHVRTAVPATFKSDRNVLSGSLLNNATTQTLAQWQSGTSQDTNSQTSTSSTEFVNAGTNNYHLKTGAVAIGLGAATFNSQSAPSDDIEGTLRGSSPDAGAYQFAAASWLKVWELSPSKVTGVSRWETKT